MLTAARRHPYHFLFAIFAAVTLRTSFILFAAHVSNDSLVYADAARNWLHHGTIALTEDGQPVPSLIRLPGYPAFLAGVFALFGDNNFTAVYLIQLVIDVLTCLLTAGMAAELFSDRVAIIALWIAALCPYTANYVALPLSESWAIFFAALAFYLAIPALRCGNGSWKRWACCGLAINASIYLRPDGGILLASLLAILGFRLVRSRERRSALVAACILAAASLLPLAPWAYRNWRVFHVFQPLAPRYANAPGEFVANGFNRWTRTWIADYASVDEIYWKVPTESPGEEIDVSDLPGRAFDLPEERVRTEQLFDEFNQDKVLSPATDDKFAILAAERIRRNPVRYYLTLPALRIADMWLRPRTEMLDVPDRWWEAANAGPGERAFAIAYALPGVLLLLAGIAGAWRVRAIPGVAALLAFVFIRSAFLGTLENPEPRYTLEMLPMMFTLAAALFQARALKTPAGR